MQAIQVTVINSLGTFTGYMQAKNGSTDLEDAADIVNELEENINTLRDMTLVQEDGTEVTFTKGALEGAVFKFKLVELSL